MRTHYTSMMWVMKPLVHYHFVVEGTYLHVVPPKVVYEQVEKSISYTVDLFTESCNHVIRKPAQNKSQMCTWPDTKNPLSILISRSPILLEPNIQSSVSATMQHFTTL